jgi:hypothetical protein
MTEKSTRDRFGSRELWESLEEMARERIQEFVQTLLEEEVTALVGRAKSERREAVDAPAVYRNGHGKPRKLAMMGGTVEVRRPRVRGLEERFESRILPLFRRRTKEVSELLPQLYLHGLAQGDFELALRGLLGEGAPLSPSSIERLRGKWVSEFEAWSRRDLRGIEPVYLWADGIYVKAGLEKDKAALLVIVAGLRDGRKVVLTVESGYRESAEAWGRLLRDLRARGMSVPRLVVADGHLGIWSALSQVLPEVAEQDAGTTRSSTCSMPCRRSCKPRPASCCAGSHTRPPGARPRGFATSFDRATRSGTPSRWRPWSVTGSAWWPSTRSPRRTGSICVRPTPWSHRSRQCGCERPQGNGTRRWPTRRP